MYYEAVWLAVVTSITSLTLAVITMQSARSERRDARAERLEMAKLAKEADGKLEQIHVLVNSEKTEGLERELASKIESLVLMKEIVAMNRIAGLKQSEDSLTTIKLTEERIAELRTELGDRAVATEIADAAVRG